MPTGPMGGALKGEGPASPKCLHAGGRFARTPMDGSELSEAT